MHLPQILRSSALAIALGASAAAQAVPVTLTQLTGLTGGTPAATAVYKADLSSVLGSLLSISITDNSGGIGGSPGQFSGFDLDAIKLSLVDCATAACAASAAGLSVFDFAGASFFSPGSQRPPADAKLFGTGPAGNTLDDAMATLSLFDGNSTTGPTAFGFISMGDDGKIGFNLSSAVDTAGLFLYIGEVGDNGEVAKSGIDVSQGPLVPEPETYALMLAGLAVVAGVARRRGRR
jgi:hypothetical protein